jgi:hypothetical protein
VAANVTLFYMRRNRGIASYGEAVEGAPSAWGAPAAAPDEDGPLTRIRRTLPSLTGTGQACANYVQANAWELRGLPIADVAARAGVSPNAVNRLSRAIGYEGYRAFSQALTLELGRILGAAYALPASGTDLPGTDLPGTDRTNGVGTDAAALAGGAGVVLRRVFELEIEALRDTLATLDRAAERAVEALAEAQQVLLSVPARPPPWASWQRTASRSWATAPRGRPTREPSLPRFACWPPET